MSTAPRRERFRLSAAVFVALLADDGVCMQRRLATGWMDGWFSLAAGGLEVGEPLRAAAAREAREEFGVAIDPDDLTYAHTLHCHFATGDWIGHVFTATKWRGVPAIMEPDRHGDLGWWPLAAPPEATIPYARQALDSISRGVPYSEFGWDEQDFPR